MWGRTGVTAGQNTSSQQVLQACWGTVSTTDHNICTLIRDVDICLQDHLIHFLKFGVDTCQSVLMAPASLNFGFCEETIFNGFVIISGCSPKAKRSKFYSQTFIFNRDWWSFSKRITVILPGGVFWVQIQTLYGLIDRANHQIITGRLVSAILLRFTEREELMVSVWQLFWHKSNRDLKVFCQKASQIRHNEQKPTSQPSWLGWNREGLFLSHFS